jgi:hypothetical protein
MKRLVPSRPMVVAMLALCVGLSGSALAQPVAHGATSLASKVKKSLRLAKAADKRSRRALAKARAVTGPQGAPGPQGPQGIPGAPGAPGAANGYVASADGVQTDAGPGADIATLNLPAGAYVVLSTMSVQNESPSNTSSITHCTLSGGSGTDDSKLGLLGPTGAPEDHGSMSLSTGTTLSSPGSVTLHCTGEGGTGLTYLQTVRLEAVQVSTLG